MKILRNGPDDIIPGDLVRVTFTPKGSDAVRVLGRIADRGVGRDGRKRGVSDEHGGFLVYLRNFDGLVIRAERHEFVLVDETAMEVVA